MTQIIINIGNRPSKLSFFRKSFIEELFKKFPIDTNTDFWNKDIKDIIYNNIEDNINTEIINNWRTNEKLIDYIKHRCINRFEKDHKKIFEDINGEFDEFKIIELDCEDDQEDYEINYYDNNREYVTAKINYKEMLCELKDMIKEKIPEYAIESYFKWYNTNKYVKDFMKDIWEYRHPDDNIEEYDFEGTNYY